MRIATYLTTAAALIAAPALAQTNTPSAAQTVPTMPPPTTAPATPTTGPATSTSAAPTTATPPATTPGTAPRTTARRGAAPMMAQPGTAAPTAPATTTIAAGLAAIPNHATLVRLVTAAQLDAQLNGPGPFTMFAPNDTAFSRLPAGTLDTLTAPANLAGLQTIIKNHIIAGTLTEAQIRQQIKAGGGRATLNTLSGQPLTASLENNVVLLTDAVGNKSFIDKADIMQTNGVIHATNGISLPKLG